MFNSGVNQHRSAKQHIPRRSGSFSWRIMNYTIIILLIRHNYINHISGWWMLVVSTPLNNSSQWEGLSHILCKKCSKSQADIHHIPMSSHASNTQLQLHLVLLGQFLEPSGAASAHPPCAAHHQRAETRRTRGHARRRALPSWSRWGRGGAAKSCQAGTMAGCQVHLWGKFSRLRWDFTKIQSACQRGKIICFCSIMIYRIWHDVKWIEMMDCRAVLVEVLPSAGMGLDVKQGESCLTKSRLRDAFHKKRWKTAWLNRSDDELQNDSRLRKHLRRWLELHEPRACLNDGVKSIWSYETTHLTLESYLS